MPPSLVASRLKQGKSWLRPAAYLTGLYLLISLLWILLSDFLATRLADEDPSTLEKIQQVKGIFFVVATSLILFFISKQFYKSQERSFVKQQTLEQQLNALRDIAREGIFDYNLETAAAQVNNQMKFYVPTEDDSIPNFWSSYRQRIHPDDRDRVFREFQQNVTLQKETWHTECRLQGADDKYYQVLCSMYLLRRAGDDRIYRLIGTVLDITELRSLQTRNYEQRLQYKRELAGRIVAAQEQERNRWAEELHDNVGQLLTVTKLYLGEMEHRPQTVERLLPETKKLVSTAMSDIRQLSSSIKPPAFTHTTLKYCLEKLLADINRVNRIQFNLQVDQLDEATLSDDHKLLSYRVVQEQLNNILKHAEAETVNISLENKNGMLSIRISDNGKGFDPGKSKTGIGLRNIQSRLQLYNGKMKIVSSEGKGCELTARFRIT